MRMSCTYLSAVVHTQLELNIVQPGEEVLLDILCIDQFNNSREAIWSLENTQEEQVNKYYKGCS